MSTFNRTYRAPKFFLCIHTTDEYHIELKRQRIDTHTILLFVEELVSYIFLEMENSKQLEVKV